MKNGRPLRLLCVITAALMLLTMAGCGKEAKTLKVGVRGDLINFGYENANTGRRDGLDIDIANELASRMGYDQVSFVTVHTNDREQLLESGAVDVIAAAYSITKEREEAVDFTPAYYVDSMKVMVETTTTFTSLQDLKGAVVGVIESSNAALALCNEMARLKIIPAFDEAQFNVEKFNGGISFVQYADYDALDDALETGEVDAACGNGALLQPHKWGSRIYLDESFLDDPYGIGTKKGSDLSAAATAAIEAMLSDGTIDRLIDKWN